MLNVLWKILHKNHKFIRISDEDSLKNEIIYLENSEKEINKGNEEIKKLKDKIENEINLINKSYDETIKELDKSFELKLQKEKNKKDKIIEELNNEVTKTKEHLENFLTQINSIIRDGEKIKKALKKFLNKTPAVKVLSYISFINKNISNVNNASKELMESISFNYNEKKI